MSVGEVFKKIRVEKNLSAKNVYSEIMNQGNYWRFENNLLSTSVDNFFKMFPKLNISLEEFYSIYSEITSNKYDLLSYSLVNATRKQDTTELKSILIASEEEYKKAIDYPFIIYQYLRVFIL
jgi:transcriptional regulator with XRE-family HTH domain